jgi:hypothetical protein
MAPNKAAEPPWLTDSNYYNDSSYYADKQDLLKRENYEVRALQDDLWCFIFFIAIKN